MSDRFQQGETNESHSVVMMDGKFMFDVRKNEIIHGAPDAEKIAAFLVRLLNIECWDCGPEWWKEFEYDCSADCDCKR